MALSVGSRGHKISLASSRPRARGRFITLPGITPMPRRSINKSKNRILLHLTSGDLGLLAPDLTHVDLPAGKSLEWPNRRIEYAYFINSGLASVVANGRGDGMIEVGLVGREGFTGVPIVMGTDRSPNSTFMQSPGSAFRIPPAKLVQAMQRSEILRRVLLNFGHTFFVQTSQTALANGSSRNEQRLARWLCMAHDRSDGDDVVLTHEFLSIMLGSQRPQVTSILDLLQKEGILRAKRGRISILDRKQLELHAGGCYGTAEAEFKRLFG